MGAMRHSETGEVVKMNVHDVPLRQKVEEIKEDSCFL
jgi:hypothetical protein